MAPGCGIASFRLILRRTDLSNFSRRGLRLAPVATYTLNARQYCSEGPAPSRAKSGNAKRSQSSAAALPADLTRLKLNELKALLRARDLPLAGTKDVLIKRLNNYTQMRIMQSRLREKEENVANMEIVMKEAEEDSTDDDIVKNAHHKHANKVNVVEAKLNPSKGMSPTNVTAKVTDATATTTQMAPKNHNPAAIERRNLPQIAQPTEQKTLANTIKAEQRVNHRTTLSASLACSSATSSSSSPSSSSSSSATSSFSKCDKKADSEVTVAFVQGIPNVTVPLPSRNEKCRFTLKPISHNVGDFIEMLKIEDRGIDRATILNKDGVRIASTCTIESLMDESFWLHINDKQYEVHPPERETLKLEQIDKVGDVKRVIAQLYEAYNVSEYQTQKSAELAKKLEEIQFELQPLEQKKVELTVQAARKTSIMTWVGLGLMSVQFGILARLTWWEYSWDIMEPVTYFVTYGTTMAMYAYYCITKQEYVMPDVKNREFVLSIYKNAKKNNFDIENYNRLKRKAAEIEYDLTRISDPLNMQLPPHVTRAQMAPPVPRSDKGVDNMQASGVKADKETFRITLPFLSKTKKDA